ncbi:MAG: LytR/AlgR family response regulator transcription factor [Vicinamibacterales bacterium]
MTDEASAKTRVVIADDEPLGRARLRMLLANEPWIEVVAESADGPSTIAAIEKFHPELVFLDVQMPGGSGFDVIEAVGAARMPFVIFVTAFDRYALRAFDVHALDYLLKPFDRDRFSDALARARDRIERSSNGDLERRLLAIVNDLKPGPQSLERFVIKSGGRVFFLRAEEIEWIEAAGNYVKLHVGAETHVFRETMNSLEARLNPSVFFRIHRSHIVNIERVRELQPWFNGEYVVFLTSGARLTLSRGYREKLQDRIGRPL